MPPVTTAETQEQQSKSRGSSPTSTVSAAFLRERRFKLSRACDRCRRRRIKCDEGHPCQACLTTNSSCTFEEPGKRNHPHKSKRTATLEDRMQHLETLIQAIPPAVFAAGGVMPPSGGLHSGDMPTSPVTLYSIPHSPHVPPPSLHVFPLTNPSTHFMSTREGSSPSSCLGPLFEPYHSRFNPDHLPEETSPSASYLYFDDEGYTRWQGETSGLPVLDLLVERHKPANGVDKPVSPSDAAQTNGSPGAIESDWFQNRTLRRTGVNPQAIWRVITSAIIPELMDSLVQCYLSTSCYILPFLHVPTFLADYGNPEKWGEPGFANFIVAICCLASDDPRVRSSPSDGTSAGIQWFDLFGRLRTLPIANQPTLYNIQADLIAAIYALGLGKISKAASLLAEAVTMSIDAGLHRCADPYDLFDPIEDEVRKRTFWCVYIWDKQLSAHFGRPPMIRLRDCDISEPAPVDDEYITRAGIGTPPPGTECRMGAFVSTLRIMVVLESVLNVPPAWSANRSSAFLLRAAEVLPASKWVKGLYEEEALLDELHRSIPPWWAHSAETLASQDTIRITQAERLHCTEHFVRLLIYRHRFSKLMAERMSRSSEELPCEQEKEVLRASQNSALQIITTYLHVATKGLMTYYGLHVIHQLTQAGRTLVAVLLSCKTEDLQHLIPSGLDALRSCVSLLRRFSGRYVYGARSGDLMEEFCRLTQIPLETSQNRETSPSTHRPPWIRPVRRKTSSVSRSTYSADSPTQHGSPESFGTSDFMADRLKNGPPSFTTTASHSQTDSGGNQNGAARSNLFASGGSDQLHAFSLLNQDMDPQPYLSSPEVMGLFDGADVQHLFTGAHNLAALEQQSQHCSGGGMGHGHFDN